MRDRAHLKRFADALNELFGPRPGLSGISRRRDDRLPLRGGHRRRRSRHASRGLHERQGSEGLRRVPAWACARAACVAAWSASSSRAHRRIDLEDHSVSARAAADQAGADLGRCCSPREPRRDRDRRRYRRHVHRRRVAARRTAIVHYTKVPSTPADPIEGVRHGVERILAAAGLKPAEVDRFVHGSTVAINALIQRKGAVTGPAGDRRFRGHARNRPSQALAHV